MIKVKTLPRNAVGEYRVAWIENDLMQAEKTYHTKDLQDAKNIEKIMATQAKKLNAKERKNSPSTIKIIPKGEWETLKRTVKENRKLRKQLADSREENMRLKEANDALENQD